MNIDNIIAEVGTKKVSEMKKEDLERLIRSNGMNSGHEVALAKQIMKIAAM